MAFYSNQPLPDTNARQAATTIRPSSTALLTIDSEDRYTDYVAARANPTSPYNFSISKSESLMPGFMTRLGISEVVFPWTIPNVNIKTNKIGFSYQFAGSGEVVTTITLEDSFYRPGDLAVTLQAAVRALAGNPLPGFLMTYGENPVGSVPLEPAFYYDSADPSGQVSWFPMPSNSAAYPYGPNVRQLFDMLGFDQQNTILALGGNGNYTLCQAIRYVDIVCNQLTNSQAQKDQTSQNIARDMLCRVYVSSAPGITSTVTASTAAFCPPGCAPTTIYQNYTMPKQIQWQPNQNIPGYLQFQVYDDSGELLDRSLVAIGELANQSTDWSMTMLISEC